MCLMLVIIFSTSVLAANKAVVIPLGTSATGNAKQAEVVAGKTFSNTKRKGLTGTLVLPPTMQTFTNDYGMKFNLIPSGTFVMGSPDGSGGIPSEPGRFGDEVQHEVTLSRPFYMQHTEVTQQKWREVVLAAETGGYLAVGALDENPSVIDFCGDHCPVENVSWEDVQEWIGALNQLEGRTGCNEIPNKCYRLPTEAEWEYAARADSATAFANGAITVRGAGFDPNLHAMGWYIYNDVIYDDNGKIKGYPSGTKPVARKQSNTWGLYDMHGNVWEWCQDWYGGYGSDPVTDPQGPDSGTLRVLRGGSFNFAVQECRSANRRFSIPDQKAANVGFRLVRSVANVP
jgi:formylglycine-generating enzyme required for sulfatase activity